MTRSVLIYAAILLAGSTAAVADSMGGARPRDPIVAAAFGNSHNDCETARNPRVQRTDINRDGRLDAIVWDDAGCYKSVGGYFALVTRRGSKWVAIGHADGRPRWLPARSGGWPDFEARTLHHGRPCFRFYEFRGGRYVANYLRETEARHCRMQRHRD